MDDEIKILTDEELETSFLDDTYKMYVKEIRKYPILSIEQQKELGRRYKENGDLKAKELLINCNLRLVVNVANRYKEILNHLQILDVVQEGNFGLIRAVETYDPDQGAFTTYAIPWIKLKITRGLAEKDQEIRKPEYFIDAKTKYLRLIEENKARGLQLPTDEEICDILNISSETLKNIRDSSNKTTVSLNQTIDDDEKSELGEFLSTKNHDYDDVLNQMVNKELLLVLKEILSPLQYFIIYHRILSEEQKTLEEIAACLNITRERVRQIEEKALDKLKPYMLEDSKVYTKTLNKIKQKEGINFKFLKTTPVSPIQIIKYMYLKYDLTDLERKVYELKLLGKYNYKEEDYAEILGISIEELKQVIISLKAKINKKFSDIKKVKNFQAQMTKTYGTRIFNIYINSQNNQEKMIDYHTISEKYSSLSLDEILGYFNDVNYNLTPDEEELIKRYFGVCNRDYYISSKEVEKEINVLKYGFIRKDKRVPLKKLYKEYLRIKDKFNAEQQLYLETYIFNKTDRILFKQTYPESLLPGRYYYLIDVLEKSYYNIHEYFENNFTKENWLEIKEKYSYLFTDERIKLLDLYYGVNSKSHTITELSEKYNIDYRSMIDLCRKARDLAINLYSGIKLKLDIDKSLYAPYIIDLRYNFTDETRNVLKLFITKNKTYDEISNITGLNKTRISNIITEGIRKIDNYRFEIITSSIIDEEELSDIFEYYGDKIPPIEKEVIRLKHLKYMENNDIASLVDKSLLEINRIVRHFNILYENYTVRNVTLTYEDISDEISKHKSESIWTEEQKEFASFYYGVKSKYNISGEKLNSAALMEKFGYNKNVYYNISRSIISSLKARKINFIKPENNYISRQKLDELLDDVHLPISDKEREIICHLFELKGFSYMTINQLSEKYKEKSGSVRRRYQRAIVSIYKYLNKEIEGIIHYETDIVPILKYFGISDRKKIEDSFKNGLTYEEIAEKYSITFDQVVTTMNRIKSNIKDLMTNPNAKKFDFDYYLEAVNNPDLPFSGDLNLARQIFDLVFGMNGERTSYPLVIEKLNLNINTSMISKILYNLMLSVCKLKDGITKDKTFTYEQVYSYYLSHYDTMPEYCKSIYQNYFEKFKKYKPISSSRVKLPYYIISDLIIDTYPDAFVLEKATKEEVIDILKKYGKKINKRVRNELMERYDITERKFMNGKDINHVFKILDTLDAKRKELGTSTLVLKK